MTREQQLAALQEMHEKIISISISKGNDYANEDVLSNFKKISQVVKLLDIDTTTPDGYALLMVVLKMCRIGNLLKKGTHPENESLEDSFIDGINYFKLAYFCHKDKIVNERTNNGLTN